MEGYSKDNRHELIEYGDLGKEKEIWQEGTNQDEKEYKGVFQIALYLL